MGMEDYTRHQQGIIKRYYDHQDTIQLQKLSELVADLYLAEFPAAKVVLGCGLAGPTSAAPGS